MPIERITIFCFAASYTVALLLEVLQLWRPRPVIRVLCAIFGAAGLLAHTLFLAAQHVPLASQFGALVYLAWILAVFYLTGSIHHRRTAWGIFVLPVVLALTVLALLPGFRADSASSQPETVAADADAIWRNLHVGLFVFASVGICVAFVASIMYLIQAHRLRAKALPGKGLRLLSLERLEKMNRLALNLAFPLLTVGLVVGLARFYQERERLSGWTDPRILSTFVLWLVFGIVLYLRYGFHQGGRRVAVLTIMAFALLLVTLVTQHPPGDTR